MHNRALPLDKGEFGITRFHHHLLDCAAGVIDPDRVQRYPLAADQNTDLPSREKFRPHALIKRCLPDLEPRRHLSYRHIRSHQQRPAILESRRTGPGDTQILRLTADIPDPLAIGEIRVARSKMLVQAIDHTHPGCHGFIDLCDHLRGEAASRRRHTQHKHFSAGTHSLIHRGQHRHIGTEIQQIPGARTAVVEINCTGNGVAGVPQYRMAHLAVQFVDLLKKMNHQLLIRL